MKNIANLLALAVFSLMSVSFVMAMPSPLPPVASVIEGATLVADFEKSPPFVGQLAFVW